MILASLFSIAALATILLLIAGIRAHQRSKKRLKVIKSRRG